MAPTAAPGYADSFATARPAGAGQAPSAAPGYADSFATAKQAPGSMVSPVGKRLGLAPFCSCCSRQPARQAPGAVCFARLD